LSKGLVQRGHYYAIVDESTPSSLTKRHPLIIPAPPTTTVQVCRARKICRHNWTGRKIEATDHKNVRKSRLQLADGASSSGDYIVDENSAHRLTTKADHIEKLLGHRQTSPTPKKLDLKHYVENGHQGQTRSTSVMSITWSGRRGHQSSIPSRRLMPARWLTASTIHRAKEA